MSLTDAPIDSEQADSSDAPFIRSPTEEAESVRRRSWAIGVWCSAGAALLYTLTNGCFRQLATEVDPWLPSAMRALVTFFFFLPMYVWASAAGKKLSSGWKSMAILTGVAFCSQLFGNVLMQYSMGVVGVAITIPLCTGAMVIASAILGRMFLKEPIDSGMALALLVLMVSIFLFRGGSEAARQSMEHSQLQMLRNWSAMSGVAAAIIPGIVFAGLSVTIRSVLNRDVFRLTPIMVVSITGIVFIWPGVFWRIGGEGLAAVTAWQWQLMIIGGLGNAVAFWCLATSLKMLPVAWVNAINVSQVALAAVLGILFFSEPSSFWLWIGLGVMTVGFLILAFRGNRTQNGLRKSPAN